MWEKSLAFLRRLVPVSNCLIFFGMFFYLFQSVKVDYDYSCAIYLFWGDKRWIRNKIELDWGWLRLILFDWFDWFDNQTRSRIDVRFCLITKPKRMIGVWLSSIQFWFDFVWLDMSGSLQKLVRSNCRIPYRFEAAPLKHLGTWLCIHLLLTLLPFSHLKNNK